ncbi:MAG: hypothetical protein K8L97_33555 [Anaerolineae bacterium]|nr:hypothetical protein [Anaerolineae bacterium]
MSKFRGKYGTVGSMWAGLTKHGAPMLTGEVVIDGAVLGIVIMPNTAKRPGSKQPDFLIYAREDERNLVEDRINQQAEPF